MKEGKSKTIDRIFIIFVALFLVQILAFSQLDKMNCKLGEMGNKIFSIKTSDQTLLINNVIRNQQRNTLMSIKSSWLNYLNTENKTMLKEEDGFTIYSNESSSIKFDYNSMDKELIFANYYNIYDKKTGDVLIQNAKPEWNTEDLNNILSLLVAPVKCFGNHGGLIVFDSNSGEIFLDTTSTKRPIGSNIFLDYDNPECKNKENSKFGINNYISNKKDSDSIEDFIYLFNEEADITEHADDFVNYPLGNYNREFIEKMILPYETFGFDGQAMQLTVLSVVNEQDVFKPYKEQMQKTNTTIDSYLKLYSQTGIILLSSMLISMIFLFLMTYLFKIKKNEEQENEDNMKQ